MAKSKLEIKIQDEIAKEKRLYNSLVIDKDIMSRAIAVSLGKVEILEGLLKE